MSLTIAEINELDSRVNVEIVGALCAVKEPAMLAACINRIQYFRNARSAKLICDNRVPADAPEYKFPGRIEWLIRIEYSEGGGITIGALQRSPGAEIEFHS